MRTHLGWAPSQRTILRLFVRLELNTRPDGFWHGTGLGTQPTPGCARSRLDHPVRLPARCRASRAVRCCRLQAVTNRRPAKQVSPAAVTVSSATNAHTGVPAIATWHSWQRCSGGLCDRTPAGHRPVNQRRRLIVPVYVASPRAAPTARLLPVADRRHWPHLSAERRLRHGDTPCGQHRAEVKARKGDVWGLRMW
jgi:hypothetical protein